MCPSQLFSQFGLDSAYLPWGLDYGQSGKNNFFFFPSVE